MSGADAPPKASIKIPRDDHGQVQRASDSLASDLHHHLKSVDDHGNYQMAKGRKTGEPGFPAQYFPDDEQADTRIAIKQKLLAGRERPLGDAMLTDEDIKWYMNKENVRKRIVFDAWYSKLFDTRDINKLRLAQQIHPDYYKIREEEIDRQAAVQKKLALIKLRGIHDLDDLKFLFAIKTGGVILREQPLYKLDEPMPGLNTPPFFKKGLWNPSKWVTGHESDYIPESGIGLGVTGVWTAKPDTSNKIGETGYFSGPTFGADGAATGPPFS